MQRYKAFVFRHGVVVDDERLQEEAFRQVLSTYDIAVTHEHYREFFAGRTDEEGFERLAEYSPNVHAHLDQLVVMKSRAYAHLSQNLLLAYEGVPELIDTVASQGMRVALVSGSTREELSMILEAVGLESAMEVAVCADDLAAKPGRNSYSLVAEQLLLTPGDCIAFEHAPAGVNEAVAAGCHCVAVAFTHSHDELVAAHEVVPTIFEWMMRTRMLGAT